MIGIQPITTAKTINIGPIKYVSIVISYPQTSNTGFRYSVSMTPSTEIMNWIANVNRRIPTVKVRYVRLSQAVREILGLRTFCWLINYTATQIFLRAAAVETSKLLYYTRDITVLYHDIMTSWLQYTGRYVITLVVNLQHYSIPYDNTTTPKWWRKLNQRRRTPNLLPLENPRQRKETG